MIRSFALVHTSYTYKYVFGLLSLVLYRFVYMLYEYVPSENSSSTYWLAWYSKRLAFSPDIEWRPVTKKQEATKKVNQNHHLYSTRTRTYDRRVLHTKTYLGLPVRVMHVRTHLTTWYRAAFSLSEGLLVVSIQIFQIFVSAQFFIFPDFPLFFPPNIGMLLISVPDILPSVNFSKVGFISCFSCFSREYY